MGSPLSEYQNSRILISSGYYNQTTHDMSGRLVNNSSRLYLITAFLKRAISSGTSTGRQQVGSSSGSRSQIMPGYSGQEFLYRGYGLMYTQVSNGFNINDDISNYSLSELSYRPEFLVSGLRCTMSFGIEEVHKECYIMLAGGVYGSSGIDRMVMEQIRGLPLIISGSEYVI